MDSTLRKRIHRTLCGVALLSLAACSGDDGSPGAAGTPGTPGVATSSSAESITVAVNNITIASPPVVDFTLTNEDGVRFTGLAQGQIRFTLAKLVPEQNGEPSHWQSYLNKTETPTVGPGTAPAVQAINESSGTLVNNRDGTYRYTFVADVTNVTSPMAVSYEPGLTHRLGMQISGGGLPVTNAVYDWRPSDGATTGLTERIVVQTSSCNECHGKLALHGGGRVDTKLCVTCHNPGSTDANSTNTVDFKVMIHKIHRGEELPSVVAGGDYAIWGFNNTKHDYSDVVLPQDIRNCTKCHDPADVATPQAGNWETVPSVEACGSCHDDVNFSTGQGHSSSNFVAQNGQCTTCHSAGGFVGSVASSHAIPAKVEGAKYAYKIVSVAHVAPGDYPVITYQVTNPATGTPYNILNASDPVWACYSNNAASMCNVTGTRAGASRLAIDIAWGNSSPTDYTNKCATADVGTANCQTATSGSAAPASTISLDGLVAGTSNFAPVDNGDGTFSVTSKRIVPSDAKGTATIAFEGHPAADFNGDGHYTDRVPVKNVIAYAKLTDAVATPRRTVVDIAKCDKCHEQLTLHGNNRTDEPQVCVMCHNANNTDIGRRPACTSNGSGGCTNTADSRIEAAIDFKFMIHAIHASDKRSNPFVVYGFGGSVNDFSKVTFPGVLDNCNACHKTNTFTVPLKVEAQASTIVSASRADPSDDTNITPTAAVCSSCHDSDVAQTHMEQNGAAFSMVGDPGSYGETCEVCHGSGRIADVAGVHKLLP